MHNSGTCCCHLSGQCPFFLQIQVSNPKIQPGTLMDGAAEFHTSLTWLIWLVETVEIENSDPKVCFESGWFHLAESQTEELESYQIPTFLCAGHMRQAENPDAFVVNNLTRFVFIPAYNCPLCIPVITPLCEERNVKTFQLNPGEIVAKQKG